jgi:hypothetical protein
MARRRLTWTVLLSAAQAGDLVTTWIGLRIGVPEGNPLVRAALAQGSFIAFGAIKAALVASLLGLLWFTGRHLRGVAHLATWRVVQGITLVFMALAISNAAGMLSRLG